jgi:hypothetical protein
MTDFNDIEFSAGEDISVNVPITKDGTALTITDATVTWKAYHTLTGVVMIKDNADIGGITINKDGESVTLAFAKEDTEDLIPLTYYHEVRILLEEAENVLVPQGRLKLNRSITLMEEP